MLVFNFKFKIVHFRFFDIFLILTILSNISIKLEFLTIITKIENFNNFSKNLFFCKLYMYLYIFIFGKLFFKLNFF